MRLPLSILFLIPLLLSIGCGSKAEMVCTISADCEEGYFCDDGTCESAECSTSADCGEWSVCEDGRCLEVEIGRACGEDEPCADGLECVEELPGGYCTTSCDSQEDCPAGTVCVVQGGEGICLLTCDDQDDCRDDYACTGGVCFLPCEDDAECDGGYVCIDGACVGSGVGRACSTDDECEDGLQCAHTDRGGYCTTACDGQGECPVGSVCGILFGEETCLASCRGDLDCGDDAFCHEGGCTLPCSEGDCPEDFYCAESGLCRPEGASGHTTIELGYAQPGTTLQFDVPPGTHSITLMVRGAPDTMFEFTSLVDPGGNERITGEIDMGFMGGGLTEPHRTMPRQEINTTQIPISDFPGLEVISGSWSFSFKGGPGEATVVLKTGGEDGGTVPLNVFVAPSAFPGSPDASSLAGDSHFQGVLAEWDHFFAQQAGLPIGEIRYFDLPAEYTDVEIDFFGGEMGYEEMFKRFGRDDGLNAFFVRSLSSMIGAIAGVSGGIPGPPRVGETPHSGVVVAVQDQPRFTGFTFSHEAGHFFGLSHTSEQNMFGGTQIHDMLSDTPECRPGTDPCTESKRHLMFPTLEPTMELLSPASAVVVRANAGID